MNRPILIAGTACAALFVCVALPAADDNKSDSAPSSANSANDSNAALFDRLDANHDGQITADEVPPEHRGLFERLLRRADSNGDGKLSREEFMRGLADDQPGRPATRSAKLLPVDWIKCAKRKNPRICRQHHQAIRYQRRRGA